MDIKLRQRGRASMDFLMGLGMRGYAARLQSDRELAEAGLDDNTLADDLDARMDQVKDALAASREHHLSLLINSWHGDNHGASAIEAFEEMRPELEPSLIEGAKGPTTITAHNDVKLPAYYDGVWFHRTTGGWDGHDFQGFIHSKIIHSFLVARFYPGDIYAQRRQAGKEAPRRDYERILDMGCGSGYYTVPLAQTFPDAEIWGCDFALPTLREAQRVANSHGWAWKLHQVACENTGFEANSFGLVTSFILLHELPATAIRDVFAEAYRLLEPGGDLLMTDVVPYEELSKMESWRKEHLARTGGEPYWREAATVDMREIAKEVGFVHAERYGLNNEKNYFVTRARKS